MPNPRIHGDDLVAVLLKPLHRFECVAVGICGGTEDDDGFFDRGYWNVSTLLDFFDLPNHWSRLQRPPPAKER